MSTRIKENVVVVTRSDILKLAGVNDSAFKFRKVLVFDGDSRTELGKAFVLEVTAIEELSGDDLPKDSSQRRICFVCDGTGHLHNSPEACQKCEGDGMIDL